jgi:hypothetical protein
LTPPHQKKTSPTPPMPNLPFLSFGTLFNMAEVTNTKAAVFNFFNIGSALLNAMMLCQLVKAINDFNGNKNKIYSLHEPDVYVISKGKDHKQYEYGNKVSIVSTKDTNIIVGDHLLAL